MVGQVVHDSMEDANSCSEWRGLSQGTSGIAGGSHTSEYTSGGNKEVNDDGYAQHLQWK